MLSLLDFTLLSFRHGTFLGRGNSFESQLLTGMFYHGLSRKTGAYYYAISELFMNSLLVSDYFFLKLDKWALPGPCVDEQQRQAIVM